MRSPLTIIRHRLDRDGADARYWEDLARELRPAQTGTASTKPDPSPTPTTDDQVDQGLERIETGGNMIADLLAKLGEDTDPGPLELGPIHGPPEPVPLPAGAVRNRQDVYTDGNRCGECKAVTTLRVCVKCTMRAQMFP